MTPYTCLTNTIYTHTQTHEDGSVGKKTKSRSIACCDQHIATQRCVLQTRILNLSENAATCGEKTEQFSLPSMHESRQTEIVSLTAIHHPHSESGTSYGSPSASKPNERNVCVCDSLASNSAAAAASEAIYGKPFGSKLVIPKILVRTRQRREDERHGPQMMDVTRRMSPPAAIESIYGKPFGSKLVIQTGKKEKILSTVLQRAGIPTMFSLLEQRRMRWLGHVCRMTDGRIPKDLLYGELATGKRPTGSPKRHG